MSRLIAILHSLSGKLIFAERIIGHFGWLAGLRILLQWKLGRALFPVTPPGSTTPMLLRPRTSDLPMFSQTFIEQQYAFDLNKELLTIVDAGANIGTACCYFATRFPNARIFALEPDRSNYEMLCRNVAHLPQVMPMHAALWSKRGTLQLVSSGRHKSQIEVCESDSPNDKGAVDCVAMSDLLSDHALQFIDLLKVDIEGAEKIIFETAGSWIARVGTICVELHETIAPGSTRAFYRATAGFARELRSGENIVVGRADCSPRPGPAERW
jgi:FkbM family methyltransferase